MNLKSKMALVLCMSAIASSALAEVNQDALRKQFVAAQSLVQKKVSDLGSCSFAQNTPKPIVDWLLQNRSKIVSDVANSSHYWVVDSQKSCAETEPYLNANIYLSYPTCASEVGESLEKSAAILIYQAAKHLGLPTGIEPTQISKAVLNSVAENSCVLEGVFDPKICSETAMFSADDMSDYVTIAKPYYNEVAKYTWFAKSRVCSKLLGCPSTWVEDKVVRRHYTKKGDYSDPIFLYQDIGTPKISIRTMQAEPYFTVSTSIPANYYLSLTNPGMLSFYTLDTYSGETEGTFMTSSMGGYTNGFNLEKSENKGSFFRKNCLWLGRFYQSHPNEYGNYVQTQVVLYGSHR